MSTPLSLARRPRRTRRTRAIRDLVKETRLHPSDFVAPLFLLEGEGQSEEVVSMPGVFRESADLLVQTVKKLSQQGILAVDLFPVIPREKRDAFAKEAVNPDSFLYDAILKIKAACPDVYVMVDVALDPFTDHGHDGLVNESGEILNDETVDVLIQMSRLAAQAGADMVAPSDMMDGRVGAIRKALDRIGFTHIGILSYAAKYASAFYGPFRDALDSAPKFGDKTTYQMDPANRREAILEALLDEEEGADILMVKPALPYLDVIAALREKTTLPIAAYHVSGEYAMAMAAGKRGWIDADRVLFESLLSIKRAGADLIFTYAASRICSLCSF